jgi:hypothetical protein
MSTDQTPARIVDAFADGGWMDSAWPGASAYGPACSRFAHRLHTGCHGGTAASGFNAGVDIPERGLRGTPLGGKAPGHPNRAFQVRCCGRSRRQWRGAWLPVRSHRDAGRRRPERGVVCLRGVGAPVHSPPRFTPRSLRSLREGPFRAVAPRRTKETKERSSLSHRCRGRG